MTVYLDYNATAPLRPDARNAMLEVLGSPFNPSSVHGIGREARRHLERARSVSLKALGQLAPDLNTQMASLVWTSGATEALNWVLRGLQSHNVLMSAIEHEAALVAVPEAQRLAVTPSGLLDLEDLETALRSKPLPSVLCLMAVNNETGVIQPVKEAARLCKIYGARLICDCVQAVGKADLNDCLPYADIAILSSHKIGGPQGVGAVLLQPALGDILAPESLIRGGGQERKQRSGTENLAGVGGFAAALAAIADDFEAEYSRIQTLRWRLETELQEIAGLSKACVIHGLGAPRAAGTVCFSAIGHKSAVQLMKLDLAGVCASSGSACSSGKVAASHVLQAMGATEAELQSVLRFSLGWASTDADIEICLEACAKLWQTP